MMFRNPIDPHSPWWLPVAAIAGLLIGWALPAPAQTLDPSDLPGMPTPYVCQPHATLKAALLAMDPPMPLLARPTTLSPDGRKIEIYGDMAHGLFIATYVTLDIFGGFNKSSCTIIVGATGKDEPIPLTPDPTR